MTKPMPKSPDRSPEKDELITLFLSGDVMTGRGIDQVLPHPVDPVLYETYVKDARMYVHLAEDVNGPIPRPADYSYIWGDALDELERVAPDSRITNLETSITISEAYWEDKGINYRMHPKNIAAITSAKIDVCVLANNHVLDWGTSGLAETLQTLKDANIKTVGAGQDMKQAASPAILELDGKGRLIIFAYGLPSSGIPHTWAASYNTPGVNLLRDLSNKTVGYIERQVGEVKRRGDVVIASIHSGGNWGYAIAPEQIEFAHNLIDRAGVDVIHGHSSHHVKGIEVYRGKLVLYGCGDFLDDYEGIKGYETFRDDLGCMYFVTLDPLTGNLVDLQMTPTQIKRFKVNRASKVDALWLRDTLTREGRAFGTRAELSRDNILKLRWQST